MTQLASNFGLTAYQAVPSQPQLQQKNKVSSKRSSDNALAKNFIVWLRYIKNEEDPLETDVPDFWNYVSYPSASQTLYNRLRWDSRNATKLDKYLAYLHRMRGEMYVWACHGSLETEEDRLLWNEILNPTLTGMTRWVAPKCKAFVDGKWQEWDNGQWVEIQQ